MSRDAGFGMQAITQNVRLRSTNRGNACNTWNVNSSGNVNNNNATNANVFEPIAKQRMLMLAHSAKRSENKRKEPRSRP